MKHNLKKMTKVKNKYWFIKVRGSYLPANLYGWLSYIPYLGYLIFTLVMGLKDTHSISMAVLYIFPNWIAAVVIMTFIASHKSK